MRILALVESAKHVCCRYRIRAFAGALQQAGATLHVEAIARGWLTREAQLRATSHFDVVILQRRLLPAWPWRTLRAHARRLVFDFDDAVLYRDSYHPRGVDSASRMRRFARTVRQADVVLSGNAFLRSCALEVGAGASGVLVIPTCVDPGLYPTARHTRLAADGLRLSWIGSSSTLQGLEQSRALWSALGRQFPALRLRMVSDRFAEFPPLAVERVSWSESTEAAELAHSDVGIAWMPDDAWSRGKCGLKVLQYMAAGLPVVANRVGVHTEMIKHGVTGFVADTPDDWVAAVAALGDPALRRSMGQVARQSVVERYSVAAWSDAFVAAVVGRGAPSIHERAHFHLSTSSSVPGSATGCSV